MNIQTVYKVTTKDCKSALSVGKNWVPELTVNYSTDSWAVPNIFDGFSCPLMAFATLDAASRFFNRHDKFKDNWVIWQALGTNPQKKRRIVRTNNKFALWRILAFWKGQSKSNVASRKFERTGFLTCSAIKLVKIVEPTSATYSDLNKPAESPYATQLPLV